MSNYKCRKCNAKLRANEAYEYRGAFACEKHFDEVIEMRDFERNQIIKEEHNKTKMYREQTNASLNKQQLVKT